MNDYPSNAHRAPGPINAQKPVVDPADPEDVKFDKVVSGKVIQRKKSLGRRLRETFFSGDSNSVVGYLGKEVLLPALQNLVTDFVTQGIERAVYGEVRSASRGPRGTAPRTHISYDRASSIVRTTPAQQTGVVRRSVTQPSEFDIGEIILESKIDADIVMDNMMEAVREYGCVTVANLKELTGRTSAYTDHKYGWMDLRGMSLRRIREGYLLQLPEPEDLR